MLCSAAYDPITILIMHGRVKSSPSSSDSSKTNCRQTPLYVWYIHPLSISFPLLLHSSRAWSQSTCPPSRPYPRPVLCTHRLHVARQLPPIKMQIRMPIRQLSRGRTFQLRRLGVRRRAARSRRCGAWRSACRRWCAVRGVRGRYSVHDATSGEDTASHSVANE